MKRERIMVIGGPGSGKSWFAGELSRRTGLPMFSVDEVVHDGSGALRPASEIDRNVVEWTLGDAWIIEGGNARTYADRVARATVIVRLQPPRWLRVQRILRRDGLNFRLLLWSIRYDAVFGPKDRAALNRATASTPVHSPRTRAEIDRLLDDLSCRIGCSDDPR